MDKLRRIDTLDNGNALVFYPHSGHLFYWEVTDWTTIRLHTVDVLEGVEREYDEWSTFEELPATVRAAIVRSPYRMREAKKTLEGAMSP